MDNPLVQLDPGLFVWTIVTFLLLLLVLAKFAWNPLLKILKEREELIQSSLEDAEKAQQELSSTLKFFLMSFSATERDRCTTSPFTSAIAFSFSI